MADQFEGSGARSDDSIPRVPFSDKENILNKLKAAQKKKEEELKKVASGDKAQKSDIAQEGDQNKNFQLSAQDKDIIEKEWVGKAEKIIKEDRNNPFVEEEDAEDLQIEYLKKRFNKDIGKSKE